MKKIFITNNIQTNNIRNTSIALGFFDGVHIGHKQVLNSALKSAKQLGVTSTILTFRNHPVEVLYNVEPEFITTCEERLEIFKEMGFDNIIMADFTTEIANMSAEQYFKDIILNFSPKAIAIGYNHTFGANRLGNIDYLSSELKNQNCLLNVVKSVKIKNEVSSSTLIRNLIKEGKVDKAAMFLEKNYSIENTIINGKKRGRLLNFPTANLQFPTNKILPRFGAYYGITTVAGIKYNSIANIGIRPTFGDIKEPILEIHILDFNKDIYGEKIIFEFVTHLRNEMKFSSEFELKQQIEKDISASRKYYI